MCYYLAMSKTKKSVATFLNESFIAWMSKAGERKTVSEFAEYLNISRSLLSHYMNGSRNPSKENVHKIAAKLGPEIFDLLGLARPDPYLQSIINGWDDLDEDQRKELIDYAEKLRDANSENIGSAHSETA